MSSHASPSSASSAPSQRPAGLTGVAVEKHGFIRTDVQLTTDELGETWSALGRGPLPFETNVPGVFAVGDVRHGSMKRLAAWVTPL